VRTRITPPAASVEPNFSERCHFIRAGGRVTEGDAAHLMEGIAVVAFDRETGEIDPDLPPAGSGLRWGEFIATMAEVYDARFGEI